MASTTSVFSLGNSDRGGNERSVVIKVKYGDNLRRFSAFAHYHHMSFEYDMNKLRVKISSFFDFDNDAVFLLTYTDDDGDAVSLTNDEELRDAVLNQRINPLRINVLLNPSTPPKLAEASRINSGQIYHEKVSEIATELNYAVDKSLSAVPDPVRGFLTKLSHDAIQTASSAPILTDLLSMLSGLHLSNISQPDIEPVGRSAGPSLPPPSKEPEVLAMGRELPSMAHGGNHTSRASDQPTAFRRCPYSRQSSMRHSLKWPLIYHDRKLRHFHKGVICDGCGMHPISGPRYKSTVKENYDLCGICFQNIGKETDYTRINLQKRDLCKHKYRNGIPAILGSSFVRDVTVRDGTVVRPSSRFTKIWKIRNSGTIPWPRGTQLMYLRGDYLGGSQFVELEIPETGFPVNEELDISVDLFAPSVSGHYTSFWRMVTASSHYFGDELWVAFQVEDQPSTSSPPSSPALLNLNLPPESSRRNDAEMLELLNPGNSDALNSPKIHSRDDLSSPVMGSLTSPASNLLIDIDLKPFYDYLAPANSVAVDNFVEQTLLRELEEMGFRQTDLNKEVLRQNQYDLEQSVQDLCSYAEWDPLLKDLQEMGFNNRQLNMKLLSKNSGSLKRAVMELIAGELAPADNQPLSYRRIEGLSRRL